MTHVVRHSGPSFDVLHGHRSFEAVQARGRWAAQQSVARYRKPGRMLMFAGRLPSPLKQFSSAPLEFSLKALVSHRWASASSR